MSLTTPLWKRSWPFLLLATSLVLGATYVTSFSRSRQEFKIAEKSLKQGLLSSSIRRYGRTIRWYTPGNKYVQVATQRLLKISDIAYQSGDWEKAIMALQHLRNALFSIRSLYQPYAKTLERCMQKLATSLSQLSPHETKNQKLNREMLRKQILKHLHANPSPPVWRTSLAAVAYTGWLLSLTILLWFWHRLTYFVRVLMSITHLTLLFAWMWGLLG